MRGNDEARMTNDETMKVSETIAARRSSSWLRHSFVLRSRCAGSFVMSLLAVIVTFSLASCNSSKKLRKANVDEVTEGMSKKQVESILGPPTTIDSKDFVLLKKTTYIYAQGKDSVTVIFKDDKVQSKASTLSE
jgi:hypothetical protein